MVYSVYKTLIIVVKLRPAEIQYDGRKTPCDEKRQSPLYKTMCILLDIWRLKWLQAGYKQFEEWMNSGGGM